MYHFVQAISELVDSPFCCQGPPCLQCQLLKVGDVVVDVPPSVTLRVSVWSDLELSSAKAVLLTLI